MPWFRMRDGAIVHINFGGKNREVKRCRFCGYFGLRLCDWRLPDGRTCDAPICPECSTEPAPEKDICPAHVGALKAWLAGRTNSTDGVGPAPRPREA